MEGSALLSTPSVSSPECHGEYPCPKAAAPLALRAGNLGHCHSWSRGAYAPRKGPPGCAGWGRRVSTWDAASYRSSFKQALEALPQLSSGADRK